MRKYTSKTQFSGLCPDGLPNRALRRSDPSAAGALTLRAFTTWYSIASNLIPGYVPEVVETLEKAA